MYPYEQKECDAAYDKFAAVADDSFGELTFEEQFEIMFTAGYEAGLASCKQQIDSQYEDLKHLGVYVTDLQDQNSIFRNAIASIGTASADSYIKQLAQQARKDAAAIIG